MSENTEHIILSALFHSEEFIRRTLPHIKQEYFENDANKLLFSLISNYRNSYHKTPSFDAIDIELSNSKGIPETVFRSAQELVVKLTSEKAASAIQKLSQDWLVEKTEKYCLDRSVYLGIMKSIDIIDGTDKKLSKDAIPDILQKSLAVSFDTAIGHDYFENFEQRYQHYHAKEKKIQTPLTMMNAMTKGGFPRKTLNIGVSGTNAGKTHMMTYFSSFWLMQGLNVLYITLEMAEERIAERIDAALFEVTLDDLKRYTRDVFGNKITKLKQKTHGKLIIKEYPTGSINVNNIRFLLDELKNKKDFVADAIVIDYLNLVSSCRIRDASNTYVTMKHVAEELRGMAVERDVVMLTATQTNRCLSPDTVVVEQTKGAVKLSDIKVGDSVLGNQGFRTVAEVHGDSKKMYKIKTKSGLEITCSADHVFPLVKSTGETVESNIRSGLSTGDFFYIEPRVMETLIDEIVSIECVGEEECIDIVVDGNRLFYANEILTHNCGQNASDFELTEVSDSHGVAMTADFLFGLIVTEDMEKLSQMRIKILKNRYGGKIPSSFMISMDRTKMTLADFDKPDVDNDSASQMLNSITNSSSETPTLNTLTEIKTKMSGFKI